jgi:hypothetical protein
MNSFTKEKEKKQRNNPYRLMQRNMEPNAAGPLSDLFESNEPTKEEEEEDMKTSAVLASGFSGHGKRNGIPLPDFGFREMEHMNGCDLCKAIWLKQLQKIEKTWLAEMLKKRTATAYQCFMKAEARELEASNSTPLSFEEKQTSICSKWRSLSAEQKQQYQEQAARLAEQKKQERAKLNKYQKRTLRKAQKLKKKESGILPKRPLNSWMLFLGQCTQQSQNSGKTRAHIIKEAKERRDMLTNEERKAFEKLASSQEKKYQKQIAKSNKIAKL